MDNEEMKLKLYKAKLRMLTEELSKELYDCISQFEENKYNDLSYEIAEKMEKVMYYYIEEINSA